MWTNLIFKVPLTTSECSFPFISLLDPYLMIGIAEVDFCEDFGQVKAIEHLGDEGEREAIFDGNLVQPPIIHN